MNRYKAYACHDLLDGRERYKDFISNYQRLRVYLDPDAHTVSIGIGGYPISGFMLVSFALRRDWSNIGSDSERRIIVFMESLR